MAALEAWVDKGTAPAQFIASRKGEKSGGTEMTRPICAWPKVPVWNETGDVKRASSFTCSAPPGPAS